MIARLCDGSLPAKQFKKTVKQLNKKLEKQDHPWRIGELTVPELKMYDVHLEGEDLLYPKEEEFENNIVEMLDYNKSYVFRTRKHVTAVINGEHRDVWNCGAWCANSYYVK